MNQSTEEMTVNEEITNLKVIKRIGGECDTEIKVWSGVNGAYLPGLLLAQLIR